MFRHCDDDLMKLLAESAPPADVDKVACFRAASAKYLKKARVNVFSQCTLTCLFVGMFFQVEAEKDKAAEESLSRLFCHVK